MLNVEGGYGESELKGGRADDEVFDRDVYTVGGLFSVNAAGQFRNFDRKGVGDQSTENVFGEKNPFCAVEGCFRTVNAVSELNYADGGDPEVSLTANPTDITEYPRYSEASAFTAN
jgi:hypothetical protein